MTGFLARFRVLTKVLAIVAVLSAIAGVITYLGISSLKSLSERGEAMARSAERSLSAARANEHVTAINRAEFRSALDPRDENRLAARSVIEDQLKRFRERLEDVSKSRDLKAQALMPAVHSALSVYEAQMKETLNAVEAAKSAEVTGTAVKLRETVMKSRADAEVLQKSIRAVADRLDQKVEEDSKAADKEYASTSRLLTVIALSGVFFGLVFGFMIGQFGVAKPIRAIVALLQQLANGNYDCEVHGTDRGDEVGDVAKTALVFKENGLAKIRMEEEQKEAEAHAAARRRQDMLTLAEKFETAVGEIVETVSSASTELEASAGTLTSTAERSQELATTVAAASEEASTNVQSVASATEELSGSVNEISRQVQESARMANEAVGQARNTTDRVSELSKAATRIGDVDRADQHHRGPDQPARAQRHHRGGARRRSRPRLCGRGLRGEGARRADREGDRRDRPADQRHSGRDTGVGQRHQGDLAAPSRSCRKSPRPSRLPSKNRARRHRKSPATSSRPHRAPSRSPPTLSTSSAARPKPDRRLRKCSRPRRPCRRTPTASSSRSTGSWPTCGLPEQVRPHRRWADQPAGPRPKGARHLWL